MSIDGHPPRAMLSRYSHVRMEAKRREIAARQRAAEEKRSEADKQLRRDDSPIESALLQ